MRFPNELFLRCCFRRCCFRRKRFFRIITKKSVFPLKTGISSYVAKEFVVHDRVTGQNVLAIIMKEYQEKEYLAEYL